MDDSLELEVRATYSGPVFPIALEVLGRVSGFYESLISAERPYYVQTEELPPANDDPYNDRITHTVNIDIGESGSGSFSDRYLRVETSNNHTIDKVATRANTDNAITWAGTYNRYDSSAAVGEAIVFTTETSVIDGQTRRQDGVIDRLSRGSWSESNTPVDISYTLTGTAIDNSSECEPNAGSITITSDAQYLPPSGDRTTTTITKRISDQYWVVSVATLNEDVLEKYLVPSAGTTFGRVRNRWLLAERHHKLVYPCHSRKRKSGLMTDSLTSEVVEAYQKYLNAFIADDMESIDALVSYPLAYIGEGEVTMFNEFPIRPSALMEQTGWTDTRDVHYKVIGISETKAHLILESGTRVRHDGSAIEDIHAFYAWKRTVDGWKMFAVSDVRVAAL